MRVCFLLRAFNSCLGEQCLEDLIVGGSQSSDGIVPGLAFEAVNAAPIGISTVGDIVECRLALCPSLVQPRVQEAKNGLSALDLLLIQEGDNGTESRGSSTGSTDGLNTTTDNDGKSDTLARGDKKKKKKEKKRGANLKRPHQAFLFPSCSNGNQRGDPTC